MMIGEGFIMVVLPASQQGLLMLEVLLNFWQDRTCCSSLYQPGDHRYHPFSVGPVRSC